MRAPTTTVQMKIGMTFPTRIAVFDLETTSPNPREARIVTAFIGVMDVASGDWEEGRTWEWLVNPGVPIPKEASDIHGVTTEMALLGMDPKKAASEIADRLDILAKESLAIVVMNASFDFTVLDRELERHWPTMRPLMYPNDEGKIRYPIVFDPMVFDRAVDKYRAGKRTLTDLCRVYGVPIEPNAHDAKADCRMAGRVAIKLLGHSRLAPLSLSEVHDKLIITKRTNSRDLVRFWRDVKMQKLNDKVERDALRASILDVEKYGDYWPMIPREVK